MKPIVGINIRNSQPEDYDGVISVMPDWWAGRDLTSMLPKVFFVHFNNTVYIAERQGELVGFLVGFFSQSDNNLGYIHFVGVHPGYRKAGIARRLYHRFYTACEENQRWVIQACTSPINQLSVAFHLRMGFRIEPGDGMVDGIAVTRDYLRPDDPKVLFKKKLA